MKKISQGTFSGERALYFLKDAEITDSVFEDGESPLKESNNITLDACIFRWKYPVWYSNNVKINNTTFSETARSGIWYTRNLTMSDCTLEAPKYFRRCDHIELNNIHFTLAQETLWTCTNVVLNRVTATGDYFGMNCENVEINHLHLTGNYCFDGGKNIVVRNSRLISKDSFWNTENVEIYDSYIVGEYFGWNSKKMKLVNCTIESNQGFNYMDDVEMINCKLIHTDLAFEFVSNAEVEVKSHIDSVKNPISGLIKCESIGELIMDPDLIDPNDTEIVSNRIDKNSDKGEERRGKLF